jgi:hypothetical protein
VRIIFNALLDIVAWALILAFMIAVLHGLWHLLASIFSSEFGFLLAVLAACAALGTLLLWAFNRVALSLERFFTKRG